MFRSELLQCWGGCGDGRVEVITGAEQIDAEKVFGMDDGKLDPARDSTVADVEVQERLHAVVG